MDSETDRGFDEGGGAAVVTGSGAGEDMQHCCGMGRVPEKMQYCCGMEQRAREGMQYCCDMGACAGEDMQDCCDMEQCAGEDMHKWGRIISSWNWI